MSRVKQPALQGRYRNRYRHESTGLRDLLRWQFEALRLRKKPPHAYDFQLLKPDTALLNTPADNASLRVTWLGHSTFLVQSAGTTFITDPHLSERASPFGFAGPKRVIAPALQTHELPPLDYVVISHDHYDHLDDTTIGQFKARFGVGEGSPTYIVPMGLKAWLAKRGIHRVEEFDWWDQRPLGDWTCHALPVQHFSGRGLHDQNSTLWAAFAFENAHTRFVFLGDCGYSRDIQDIGHYFDGFDLALIPVGAYAPRWFMRPVHMDPDEAVQAHIDLKARYSIGMHWGTFFGLTDEDLDEPPRLLTRALAKAGLDGNAFRVLQHGETDTQATTGATSP